ncbi:heme oxygenase (biliverdin-producing) [Allonocardiopsis opalescens]|uniref:Heme oxygenase n=1 Tax=Allonocardiopsis opalescens TaxID=1144618 RepID=A0A2T0PW30_9ACTN|nr:biliverdin-producing heme oxygenase [Allonocardiopsis opalescens]PRX95717.1 heme oxygenase [Allonocardiopsis opalescens]
MDTSREQHRPDGAGGSAAEPFSARLRAATWDRHAEAERDGYLTALMAGRVSRGGYAEMVAQHYFAYAELERVGRLLAAHPVAAPFVRPELERVPALERDLEFLYGPGWRARVAPSAATGRYVRRLGEMADWPAGFVAHHYTRYIGDLSGGQFIRRFVSRHYGFPGDDGTAFYVFDALGSLPRFKDRYRAALDGLAVGEEERARVVAETVTAYRLNIEVLAELGRSREIDRVA